MSYQPQSIVHQVIAVSRSGRAIIRKSIEECKKSSTSRGSSFGSIRKRNKGTRSIGGGGNKNGGGLFKKKMRSKSLPQNLGDEMKEIPESKSEEFHKKDDDGLNYRHRYQRRPAGRPQSMPELALQFMMVEIDENESLDDDNNNCNDSISNHMEDNNNNNNNYNNDGNDSGCSSDELDDDNKEEQQQQQQQENYKTISQIDFMNICTDRNNNDKDDDDNNFFIIHFFDMNYTDCEIIDNYLKELAIVRSGIQFYRMDGILAPFFRLQFNVTSYPCVLAIKRGQVVSRLSEFHKNCNDDNNNDNNNNNKKSSSVEGRNESISSISTATTTATTCSTLTTTSSTPCCDFVTLDEWVGNEACKYV